MLIIENLNISFLSEYRDITFDKIYWEINKGWSEELRNNRTVPQENKKYWNDELKLVEESYNNNYENSSKCVILKGKNYLIS